MSETKPSAASKGAICLVLALMALGLFWPVFDYPFINLDDPEYLVENPRMLTGLTVENVKWAFTTGHAANWHPLTWISHMLDMEWFGKNPKGHHVVNVVLHLLNTVLLFLALDRMTSWRWRSAFVAALFAVHPLHVESVAWVAERKDLLSGFFFMLTLLAYTAYVRGAGGGQTESAKCRMQNGNTKETLKRERSGGEKTVIGEQLSVTSEEGSGVRGQKEKGGGYDSAIADLNARTQASVYYLLALVALACGLMSKPMLVTVPFVLLLADLWPLGRRDLKTMTFKSFRPLIIEKIPFFALSIGSSVVTFLVQQEGAAVGSLDSLPLWPRIANAVASYVKYLAKTFWPADLAVFYPHPETRYPISVQWPAWQTGLAAVFLVLISAAAVRRWRREPWIATGWFWFLGMLVPVIGIVQVGSQAMADRYMYLPIIGIFLAMTWAIGETVAGDQGSGVRRQETEVTVDKAKFRTRLLGAAGLAAVVCCAVVTFKQVRVWQDDVSLFTHALKVTRNNGAAHFNLGTALGKLGKLDEAIAQFQSAVAASPGYAAAYYNLGFAYLLKGAPGDAVAPLERATALDPRNAAAQQKLGSALLAIGRLDEASYYFKEALQDNPADAESRAGLGRILAGRGKYSEASDQFSEAVRLAPEPENYFNLGVTPSLQGRRGEAAQNFRDTLQHAPEHVGALNELAWLLATSPEPELRDGQEAVRIAARAAQLTGHKQPMVLGTLAAAYAESGQFEEAAKTARTARDLAVAAGMKAVAEKNSELAGLYAQGKPYRQSASPPAGTPSKADP